MRLIDTYKGSVLLREREIGNMKSEDLILDKLGKTRNNEVKQTDLVYLDHAGTPLPLNSYLQDVFNELLACPFANPHSVGGKISQRTDQMIQNARIEVLRFFNMSEHAYDVIFTANATGGVKTIIEIMDWSSTPPCFIYPQNIHTSLLGIRNYCESWECLPVHSCFETNRDDNTAAKEVEPIESLKGKTVFFATPGECNMSGAKLNLHRAMKLIKSFREQRECDQEFFPDNAYCPDFFILSFYKIFGYPTGIGALIVKKAILTCSNKRYFGGGTLLSGAVDTNFMVPRPKTSVQHYEDGTINFHGIAALRHGFHFLSRLGGMSTIQEYTYDLFLYLLQAMKSLKHEPSQLPLCIIYSLNNSSQLSTSTQGPTIAFNLQYADGIPIGFHEVNQRCSEHQIQIRTGCFCNLGGCQYYLKFTGQENEEFYHLGRICSDQNEIDIINNRQTGACRVSLGFGSTKSDCDQFLMFLRQTFLHQSSPKVLSSLPNRSFRNIGSPSLNFSDSSLYWHQTIQSFPIPLSSSSETTNRLPVISNYNQKLAKLSAIFVYPIKSCAGVRVNDWPISSHGLRYDRHFAIINTSTGRVITQKQYPVLALVQPSFHLESQRITLQITSPSMNTILIIPLENIDNYLLSNSEDSLSFQICGRKVTGQRISHNASQWFTQYLHQYDESIRSLSPDLLPSFELLRYSELETEPGLTATATTTATTTTSNTDGTNTASYANTAQYLLLTEESVSSLIQLIYESNLKKQEELETTTENLLNGELSIKVENFRPNLVVAAMKNSVDNSNDEEDSKPHREDSWESLTIPLFTDRSSDCDISLCLNISGPCSRCSMVNVNGSTGVMNCKVFEALKGYRKVNRQIYFGQFLTNHSLLRSNTNEVNVTRSPITSLSNTDDYRIRINSTIAIISKD